MTDRDSHGTYKTVAGIDTHAVDPSTWRIEDNRIVNQHDLKAWPEPFAAVADGTKTFEYRIDDRGVQTGDELVLREWNPHTETYTGRRLRATVGYVLRGPDFGLQRGYVVMSLLEVS